MSAATPAPAVLFVYNRPAHTARTLDALAGNTLAPCTALTIFSDGPRTADDRPQVEAVRALVAQEARRRRFAAVEVHCASANKGLKRAVIAGVSQVLAAHDRVIVLEDDLLAAPDFLAFVNACLTRYRDDPTIGSISGYGPLARLPAGASGDVYVLPRSGSHGWATWADRWQAVDWTLPGYAAFRADRRRRRAFARAGADRTRRLEREMAGEANSWSIRFGFSLFERDLLTIYPRDNRILNIGGDGSGVHDARGFAFNTALAPRPRPFTLTPLSEDPRIVRAAARLYGGGPVRQLWHRWIGQLRRGGCERAARALSAPVRRIVAP